MRPDELQQLLISYHNAHEQGQISKEELVALIQGIDVMELIADYVKDRKSTRLNSSH